ncbi:MAG: glycosyltransferase [Dehalococcoidia bacterium]
MLKLTVYCIAKNEEMSLPVMLDSVKDIADEIVVCDTGSTDRTIEVAKRYTDKVYSIPWEDSFAKARNLALEKCTGDWILSMDCDEVLTEETAKNLKPVLRKIPDNIHLILVTMRMLKDDGSLHQSFLAERVIRNHVGVRFEGDMHNWVETAPGYDRIGIPELTIDHNRAPKSKESRMDRCLQRLQMSENIFLPKIEADPNDRRSIFYLAGTYFDSGMHEKAINWYERHLTISKWNEENYQSSYLLAQAYASVGRPEDARNVLAAHCIDNWRRGEGILMLGELAYIKGDYEEAEFWMKTASLKPMPVDPFFVEADAYTWRPHHGLWLVYRKTGNTEQAIKHGRIAIEQGTPYWKEIIGYEKDHTDYPCDRIAFLVDRGQMDFLQSVVDHFINIGKDVQISSDINQVEQIAEESDCVFCEWAGDLAIKLTNLEKKGRIIVRIHGYETHSGHLQQVNWRVVDDVIFVAQYLKDLACEQVPGLDQMCKCHVVPGGIEVDKFSIAPSLDTEYEPGKFLTIEDEKLPVKNYEKMLTSPTGKEWWSRPYEYAWILNHLNKGEKVLDFGAGYSGFAELMAEKGCNVARQDVDAEAMRKESERNPNIPVVIGSDIGQNVYDAIVSCSVLEHLNDISGVLKNCYNALRPGGRLVMTYDVPRVKVDALSKILRSIGFVIGDTPANVPSGAIGGTWKDGWEIDNEHGQLRCYALVATRPEYLSKTGKRIAMACYGNYKKNLPLALQIFAKCPVDYELHIAIDWQDHRTYGYVMHLIDELGLRERVFFYPWQADLNTFYADKDYYLSTSIEESFCYSLAQGMAAGLKPVIHSWLSARDFYKPEWIFKTIDEAVQMLTCECNPEQYRQYAIDHLNISKNLKRIHRIVTRPNIAIIDDEGGVNPYGFANKLAVTLNDMGYSTEAGKPDLVILTGHEPKIPDDMKGIKSVLWHCEQVGISDEHSRNRLGKIAQLIPSVDLVVTHNPLDVPIYKEFGARRVEFVSCACASPPFGKAAVEKIYDVGFSGCLSNHRKAIIGALCKSEKFKVTVFEDCNHEALNEFYNRCKIVLNLHISADGLNIESRLGEAMAAGAFVISEPLPEGYKIPFIIETEAANIEPEIIKWLDNTDREKLANAGHSWIWSNQTLTGQLEKILELADAI